MPFRYHKQVKHHDQRYIWGQNTIYSIDVANWRQPKPSASASCKASQLHPSTVVSWRLLVHPAEDARSHKHGNLVLARSASSLYMFLYLFDTILIRGAAVLYQKYHILCPQCCRLRTVKELSNFHFLTMDTRIQSSPLWSRLCSTSCPPFLGIAISRVDGSEDIFGRPIASTENS